MHFLCPAFLFTGVRIWYTIIEIFDKKYREGERIVFCPNCGNPIDDDAVFCPGCGIQLSKFMEETAPGEDSTDGEAVDFYEDPGETAQPEADAAKKRRPAMIFAVIVSAALVVCLLVFHSRPSSLDVSQYTISQFVGYENYGSSADAFDWKSFEMDVARILDDKNTIAKDSRQKIEEKLSAENEQVPPSELILLLADMADEKDCQTFVEVCKALSVSADPSENLKNGDTLTLKYSYDNAAIRKYGIAYKGTESTLTVEGLQEAETYDAFADVKVDFEGVSPDGTAQAPAADDAHGVEYSVEPGTGLANGDEVTVTVHPMEFDDFSGGYVEEYQAVPAETSKTFTVEGLSEYLSSADQLSTDALRSMQSTAENLLDDIVNSWMSEQSSSSLYTKLTYCGLAISVPNDEGSAAGCSTALIYRMDMAGVFDTSVSSATSYLYCSFPQVIVNSDKSVTYDSLLAVCISSDARFVNFSSGGTTGSVPGYDSPEKLSSDIFNADTATVSTNFDQEVTSMENPCTQLAEEDKSNEDGSSSSSSSSKAASSSNSIDTMKKYEKMLGGIETDDGQIFTYSSDEYLSDDEIDSLTRNQAQVAVNEIYARNGAIFDNEGINEYYSQYDWYEPSVSRWDMENHPSKYFNKYERKNIDKLHDKATS